ncbi:MAG: hypothetical protein LQ338_005763 [Usnochroma carphineum]|nr:MAG: hypothetical protein LQ338_005763 [Usnochroma carphineum]
MSFSLLSLSTLLLLLLPYLAFPVASHPLDDRDLSPASSALPLPHSSPNANLSPPLPKTPSLNDWENFAYPIPYTKRTLKGRIFTSKRLRPRAVHLMLDGGLAHIRRQLAHLGYIRLRPADNPYIYQVHGCRFSMDSKTRDGRPMMTYRMIKDVFLALEQVLENDQRFFEASFVLVDEDGVSWGHGEVVERVTSNQVSVS